MGDGLNTTRKPLVIREADDDDAWFLYRLRNQPSVREASFDSSPLAWERHTEWFKAKQSDGSRIFVVEVAGEPAGYVRFHPEVEGDYDVAVAIDEEMRGRGHGTEAIRVASAQVERDGASRLIARIKPGNDASIRAFEAAGYSGGLRLNGDGSQVVLTRVTQP